MKTFTVRLPEKLVAELEAESRARHVTKSEVVRERLATYSVVAPRKRADTMNLIRDLIGTVEGGPTDVSARKKHYLKEWGYGQNRDRRQRISRRAA